MTTVYVIDIDGTVANNDHRRILLKHRCIQCLTLVPGVLSEVDFQCTHCQCMDGRATNESWKDFNRLDLMAMDTPIVGAQKGIKALESQGYPVHYMTARGDAEREVTIEWLTRYFGFNADTQSLITRLPKDEGAKSHLFKEAAIERLKLDLEEEYPSFVFLDDKASNLAMFAKYGLTFKAPEFWQTMRF